MPQDHLGGSGPIRTQGSWRRGSRAGELRVAPKWEFSSLNSPRSLTKASPSVVGAGSTVSMRWYRPGEYLQKFSCSLLRKNLSKALWQLVVEELICAPLRRMSDQLHQYRYCVPPSLSQLPGDTTRRIAPLELPRNVASLFELRQTFCKQAASYFRHVSMHLVKAIHSNEPHGVKDQKSPFPVKDIQGRPNRAAEEHDRWLKRFPERKHSRVGSLHVMAMPPAVFSHGLRCSFGHLPRYIRTEWTPEA